MNKSGRIVILVVWLTACSSIFTPAMNTDQAFSTASTNTGGKNDLPGKKTLTVTMGPNPTLSFSTETATPHPSATATVDSGKLLTSSPLVTQGIPLTPGTTLFIWTFDHAYSEIDLAHPGLKVQKYPSGKYPAESEGKLGPGQAVDLAFSQSSQQIAYLTSHLAKEAEPRELWISDLHLQNIERVWVDDRLWLGDIELVSVFFTSQITWDIGDRYIIIASKRQDTREHLVVYDVVSKKSYQWEGKCQLFAKSPLDEEIATWCTIRENGAISFVILGRAGILQVNDPPASIVAETSAWRFSPDGQRVLYLSDDMQWRITNQSGETLNLPIHYENNTYYSGPGALNIQWSLEGSRVLIYGIPEDLNLCPKRQSTESGDYEDHACWLVFNAETGTVVWWPTLDMGVAASTSLEYLILDYNMSISPDGKWLATTLSQVGFGHLYHLVVISIVDGKTWNIPIDSFLLPAYYLNWASN
jgi:hypothetical protein